MIQYSPKNSKALKPNFREPSAAKSSQICALSPTSDMTAKSTYYFVFKTLY